jgi:hypothetical protein
MLGQYRSFRIRVENVAQPSRTQIVPRGGDLLSQLYSGVRALAETDQVERDCA